jgi:hypothetical protein
MPDEDRMDAARQIRAGEAEYPGPANANHRRDRERLPGRSRTVTSYRHGTFLSGPLHRQRLQKSARRGAEAGASPIAA